MNSNRKRKTVAIRHLIDNGNVPMGTLHSHSGQFCKHASDTLEQMVHAAIEAGYCYIGLSEHMPRYSDDLLYPEEIESGVCCQDLVRTFDDYVREARRLQRQSRISGQISTLVGMETELTSRSTAQWQLENISELRENYDLDYVVGSVHHLNGIPIDFNREMWIDALNSVTGTQYTLECLDNFETSKDGNNEEFIEDVNVMYREYFDMQHLLIKHVEPEVIAHFDLIRKYAPPFLPILPSTLDCIKRNIELVNSYGALIELNTRRMPTMMHPMSDILPLMNDSKITISDDAHSCRDIQSNQFQSALKTTIGVKHEFSFIQIAEPGTCCWSLALIEESK